MLGNIKLSFVNEEKKRAMDKIYDDFKDIEKDFNYLKLKMTALEDEKILLQDQIDSLKNKNL